MQVRNPAAVICSIHHATFLFGSIDFFGCFYRSQIRYMGFSWRCSLLLLPGINHCLISLVPSLRMCFVYLLMNELSGWSCWLGHIHNHEKTQPFPPNGSFCWILWTGSILHSNHFIGSERRESWVWFHKANFSNFE